MKVLLRVVIALFLVVLVWWLSQTVAAETGEVVILTTEAGQTRLWVVDHDGNAWLRAGSDQSGWFGPMREQAAVLVERDGQSMLVEARPQPDQRDQINALMRDKYAWRDAYISFLFSRDDAMPIRLVPISAPQRGD